MTLTDWKIPVIEESKKELNIMTVFHYLKQFQQQRNIIILEWTKQRPIEKIFLVIDQDKLFPLTTTKNNYQLIYQANSPQEVFLTTFIYQDQHLGSVRFIGDAYWHEQKKRYIAILWLYGNNQWQI